MEEIKVGEYVRTVDGYIDKVTEISQNYILLSGKISITEYGESRIFVKKNQIIKHFKNIIDLIEEGDYVNGEKVINADNYDGIYTIEWEYGNVYTTEIINDKFIKSIVTKEQFKNIEYRLED